MIEKSYKFNFIQSKPHLQSIISKRYAIDSDRGKKSQSKINKHKNLNSEEVCINNSKRVNKIKKKINKPISYKKLFLQLQYKNVNKGFIENYTNKGKLESKFFYDNDNKNKSSDNIIKSRENKEFNENIQSKIFKKVVENSFNSLIKYCYSFIINEFYDFLNKLKKISYQNSNHQKAYKRKNIRNKKIFKKTPLNHEKKEKVENYISPLIGFNMIKTAKLKFDGKNLFTSSNKKSDAYSSYYNINNTEEKQKESFSNTIQSNKSNTGFYKSISSFNKLKVDIYVKKKNLKKKKSIKSVYVSPTQKSKCVLNIEKLNLNKDYYNILTDNNEIEQIKIIKNINNEENKNIKNSNSLIFNINNLVIDKNSFYYNKSRKHNIYTKKVRESNEGINITKNFGNKKNELNKENIKLKKKKKSFMNKLKNIAFCIHMKNLLAINNNFNKANFLTSLQKLNIKEDIANNINKIDIKKEIINKEDIKIDDKINNLNYLNDYEDKKSIQDEFNINQKGNDFIEKENHNIIKDNIKISEKSNTNQIEIENEKNKIENIQLEEKENKNIIEDNKNSQKKKDIFEKINKNENTNEKLNTIEYTINEKTKNTIKKINNSNEDILKEKENNISMNIDNLNAEMKNIYENINFKEIYKNEREKNLQEVNNELITNLKQNLNEKDNINNKNKEDFLNLSVKEREENKNSSNQLTNDLLIGNNIIYKNSEKSFDSLIIDNNNSNENILDNLDINNTNELVEEKIKNVNINEDNFDLKYYKSKKFKEINNNKNNEINNNDIEKNIQNRNLILKEIIKNIHNKEKNNIIINYIKKWKDIIKEVNEIKINYERSNKFKEENLDIVKISNNEIKFQDNEIKALFGDEVKEENQKEILDEILNRFRVILILFYLKKSSNISDSSELNLDEDLN